MRGSSAPTPPGWVREWIGDAPARAEIAPEEVSLELVDEGGLAFPRARVVGARVRADLCRPELLVEIEALADVAP